MNERIRELAEQVGAVRNVLAMGRHDGVLFTESELKKFAELIVEKCAGIIESQDVDPSFKLRMSWAVKKHFGVK